MRKKANSKSLWALSTAVLITFLGTVPAPAIWQPEPEVASSDQVRITLADGTGAYSDYSKIQPSENGVITNLKCESFESPACAGANFTGVASMILGPCTAATQTHCVESLAFSSQMGQMTEATPGKQVEGYRPQGKTFGDFKIPDGDLPSLWVTSVTNSANVGTYVLSVSIRYVIQNGLAKSELLDAEVVPVREVNFTGNQPVHWDSTTATRTGNSDGPAGVRASNLLQCATVDTNYCTEKVEFTAGTRIKLKIRIPSDLTGWLKGRLKDPIIASSPLADNQIAYTIEAEAVEVPQLSVLLSKSDPVLETVKQSGGNTFVTNAGEYSAYRADAQAGMDIVNAAREGTKDTSAAAMSAWQFTTISGSEIRKSNLTSCMIEQKGFVGIVTTNAMAYSGGVPSWDGSYLGYKVAGLHYSPNGKDVELGVYDLAMKSDLARCLYGFTNAPVSATVAVVGTGDQNIATTIVSEKDGWLKLAAYGFTFSEKEIQVKLTQPQNKTLTKFAGSTRTLTSKQKAEIKAVVAEAKGNPKFICTGVYANAKDKVTALKRARAACDYAKSLDKNHSYWAQAKQTKAKSYDGKVMIVSK